MLRARACCALVLLWSCADTGQSPRSEVSDVGATSVRQEKVSALASAIAFEENAGQWPAEVAFMARVASGQVWATRDGALVHSLLGKPLADTDEGVGGPPRRGAGWSLVERLEGNVPALAAAGASPASAHVSYFLGNDRANWARNIATYNQVWLGEAWPGVRVSLRSVSSSVEKLFHVAPGGDPSQIRVSLEGALDKRLSSNGELLLQTGNGEVALSAPVAYQDSAQGTRNWVHVQYALTKTGYGFRLGDYDKTRALVIDPVLQATYLGGAGSDVPGSSLAFDPATGDVFVAGYTSSTTFPGTAGGAQPTMPGGSIACSVTRLNASLTSVVQSTYLGGVNGLAFCNGVLVHPSTGDVYVSGYAQIFGSDFPGVTGGAQAVHGGSNDIVIARLGNSLTTLVQSTYFGGTGNEGAAGAMALHPLNGNLYFASQSSAVVPSTAGGAQPAWGGASDAFVVSLNAGLTAVAQATMLGGAGNERRAALAIHPSSGDVYVELDASATGFPGTASGAQPAFGGGGGDVVVTRLNAALTSRLNATYFGGATSAEQAAPGIVVHPTTGDVYVLGTGVTAGLPGTTGGAQPAGGGGSDAFIGRFDSTLGTLLQASYVGSAGTDAAFRSGLAFHAARNELYVAGTAGTGFPGVAGGAQSTHAGSGEAFVARFSPSLASLVQSTYFGGTGNETTTSIGLHPSAGFVYIVGAAGTGLPNTAGGAQTTSAGSSEVYIARFTEDLAQACGNGLLEGAETCDDANRVSGDGCSATCVVESGYACPRVSMLVNGDVEQPASATTGNIALYTSPASIAGWTVSSGTVDVLTRYSTWVAPTASQVLDLSGSAVGTIQQTLTTVPGRTYVWELRLAANNACGPSWKPATFAASGATPSSWNIATSTAPTSLAWDTRFGSFVAGTSSTTLALSSLTASNCGPLVDAIRLYDVTDIACVANCGNGWVEGGEACDDGNVASGDGCSSTCTLEAGASCSAPANLVSNGSFESPAVPAASFGTYSAAGISGWTIAAGTDVDLVSNGYAGFLSPVGSQGLDTSGNQSSQVSQVVPTVAGAQYVWVARYASLGAGRQGAFTRAFGAESRSYFVTNTQLASSANWDTVGGKFSPSGSTSFDIQSLTAGNNGLSVDDVRIVDVQSCTCDGNAGTGMPKACSPSVPICMAGVCVADAHPGCS